MKRDRRRRGVVAWVVAAVAGATTLAAALGPGALGSADGEGARAARADLRLPGSAATLEGLGRSVLAALVRGDTAALASLRLTREEHDGIVWPELPASRAEVGFPADFAWTNIELRNRRSLARLLPVFRGLEPAFLGVQCRGGTRTFETFRVRTDCWTLFTLPGREGPLEARLFKDVLVRGGGHKIFRYYEDLPRSHGTTTPR